MQHPTFERAAILQTAQQILQLTRIHFGLLQATTSQRLIVAGVSALRGLQAATCRENATA